MTHQQTVIDLNNNAIAFLRQGYHEYAIENLKVAVMMLLNNSSNSPDVVVAQRREQLGLRQRDVTTTVATIVRQFPRGKQLQRVKIGVPAAASDETRIALGSMYCRAFLVASNHHHHHQASELRYSLLVAVVLYNLALVNHWCGIINHTGVMKSRLTKALRLYESVLSVIQHHPRRSAGGTNAGIDMYHVTLAVTQNMGQIHSYLFQRHEATACFDCLRQLLTNENQVIPEDDFAIFFVSAMFQANELHLAPAA